MKVRPRAGLYSLLKWVKLFHLDSPKLAAYGFVLTRRGAESAEVTQRNNSRAGFLMGIHSLHRVHGG